MAYQREEVIEKHHRDEHRKKYGKKSVFKFVSPGNPGVPDRIFIKPIPPEHVEIVGKYLRFVEMKSPQGGLDPAQVRQIKNLRDFGFTVLVVDKKETDIWEN